MRRQLLASVRAVALLTIICGVLYPLAATGIARAAFADRASGSLIRSDGTVIGSKLIGQAFTGNSWFHSRPSAAGDGHDAMASGASNLGPTNPDLHSTIAERASTYRTTNGLGHAVPVPIDAVTASGSGLDPHISVENARLQAQRVADARGMSVDDVVALIEESTGSPLFGFIGTETVNVVELNIAVAAAG